MADPYKPIFARSFSPGPQPGSRLEVTPIIGSEDGPSGLSFWVGRGYAADMPSTYCLELADAIYRHFGFATAIPDQEHTLPPREGPTNG